MTAKGGEKETAERHGSNYLYNRPADCGKEEHEHNFMSHKRGPMKGAALQRPGTDNIA
jgi:hypothetical protein